MRKFKIAHPPQLSARLREKAAQAAQSKPRPQPAPAAEPDTFEATMARAFPPHLRGSISGCCDSMADGHGTQ
ncbi:hypothetical protein QEH52_01815 [Coraliomargarita sp. SDUM461003]|uniref:Uncharacterized protein n=1 Tax=Thalassobacterium maritimum TaxID=3041265 RepID=A0ABU1ASK9_9BACT|nr:hypothetical protein [Coraliomargarita sp. SDUM461003]MDQ8206229.1 hypothetical protein [Coraliomargarita sp. SDUM461003]